MTDPEHDDEKQLRELFDATVEPPGGPLLVRMAARSKDVPARARRSFWRSLRAPVAFAFAGALAVTVAVRPPAPRTAATGAASVFESLGHAAASAAAQARLEQQRDAEMEDDDESELLADLAPSFDGAGSDDELGLDMLAELDGEEAEEWLDATVGGEDG